MTELALACPYTSCPVPPLLTVPNLTLHLVEQHHRPHGEAFLTASGIEETARRARGPAADGDGSTEARPQTEGRPRREPRAPSPEGLTPVGGSHTTPDLNGKAPRPRRVVAPAAPDPTEPATPSTPEPPMSPRAQNPDKKCGHCKQAQRAHEPGCPRDPKNRKRRAAAPAAAAKSASKDPLAAAIKAAIAKREQEITLFRQTLEVLEG